MFRKGISRFTSRYADYLVTLTERDTKNYRMRREQILITVGRLTHVKGIDMLAELAPKVLNRHEYCMQDFAGSFFQKHRKSPG